MNKAYSPRAATVDLIRNIKNLDGVERVHSIAPRHGISPRPAGIRVYLETVNSIEKVYTDFTIAEAREWLAAEQAAN